MAGLRNTPATLAILVILTVLAVCSGAGPARGAQYDYIDISNPFLRKIPLAVPLFKTAGNSEPAGDLVREGADLLARTLNFTGYFKLIDRGAFLVTPETFDVVVAGGAFRAWTGIGAELLVTGGLMRVGSAIQVELRLYDTFNEELKVGKRYKGGIDDLRRIVRRFCSEVILELTGRQGFFDSRIAYVRRTDDGAKEIYTCDFDGRDSEPVTRHGSTSLFPAWSSDGRWLAYTSFVRGKPNLHIRHMTEKRGHVVDKPGINSAPAWHPSQFALAAVLSFSGDPEIYLLTGNGKIRKKLTNTLGIDDTPSFSPDGKQMAFVSNRAGTPQIYIKNLETGQDRRLTFEGRYNQQPCWSPAGDRIAFASMRDGRLDIHTVGVNGEDPRQLTREAGDNESPSFSPDGSMLVFASNRTGQSRIYVMTAYGTDQRRLPLPSGELSNPDWSPNISH